MKPSGSAASSSAPRGAFRPLFTNGENHQMNAGVSDNGGPYNLFDYRRGCFEGGHAAVKSAQDYIGPVDLLVYPAAFAYRPGIELYLKHLVCTLNTILETGGLRRTTR